MEEFANSDAAGPAWEATVPLAIARNGTVYVHVGINTLEESAGRRLNTANGTGQLRGKKHTIFDQGVSVHFSLSYTQEETGSTDINATVSAIQSNFSSSVDDGSFRSLFVTQLRARGASEDFIARAVPSSLRFASRTVTTTSYRPTARPTRSPTACKTPSSFLYCIPYHFYPFHSFQ